MQKVRASSAKSQAESALTVFELRDEIHRLSKENSLLKGVFVEEAMKLIVARPSKTSCYKLVC